MLLNCGAGEDSWKSLGQQGDQTSQSYRKSVLSIHWKDWCWSWNSNTLATWCEELIHWEKKKPNAGKYSRQAEKGTTEDEMVGWHHWLDGHEFEQTLGDGDGQGSLACCSPWGRKESDKTEQLKNWWFSNSPVWIWELDHKEGWAPKNWCFQTVVLEKTLESPLDCKEIQPIYPKGNQSWIFIGRTDAEVEAPTLWPPDVKNWLIWKDPDAGKDGRQEEKGTTEDEMVGWHHWLDGHEFEQTLGDGDRQGSLACCSPWGREKSDTT